MEDKSSKTPQTRLYAPSRPNQKGKKAQGLDTSSRKKNAPQREQSVPKTSAATRGVVANRAGGSKRAQSKSDANVRPQKSAQGAAAKTKPAVVYKEISGDLKRARTSAQYAAMAQKAGVKGEISRAGKSNHKPNPPQLKRALPPRKELDPQLRGAKAQRNDERRTAPHTYPAKTTSDAPKKPAQPKRPIKRRDMMAAKPPKTGRSITIAETAQEREQRLARRAKRRKTLLIVALGAALLCGLVVGAKFLFEIRAIMVDNRTSISDEDIISLSGISGGENLLLLDTRGAESAICEDASLNVISIEKRFPDTVVITVEERALVAAISCAGHLVGIDMEGNVIGIDREEYGEAISILGFETEAFFAGENICENADYARHALFLVLKAIIDNEDTVQVVSIDMSNPLSIKLSMASSLKVCIGEADEIEEKLRLLASIEPVLVAEGKTGGVLDISVAEKPVYHPAEGETVTPAPSETPATADETPNATVLPTEPESTDTPATTPEPTEIPPEATEPLETHPETPRPAETP